MKLLTQTEKEAWLKKNDKLIQYWVWQFNKYHCFSLEELKQECYLQAWVALSKFDVEKGELHGNKISTYVSTNIRGYLQSYHAKYGNTVKTTWDKLKSNKETNISYEDFLDYDNQNDLTVDPQEERIHKLPLDHLSTLQANLTLLEYEILINEYDLDPKHKFSYGDSISITKASLLPLILTKLRNKLPQLEQKKTLIYNKHPRIS